MAVSDPYRWLENAESPEVQQWARDQDAFARTRLANLPFREEIANRLRELSYVENVGIPRHAGSRLFFQKRDAHAEKSAVWVREGMSGPERVLLDPNAWSADGAVSLGAWNVSWDGSRCAYAVKANNSDEATIHVIDVATGVVSTVDVLEGAKYAWPSWTSRGDGFYYTRVPPAGTVPDADRPGYAEVRFHQLGSAPSTDPLVHARTGDPKTFISASMSKDGRWLLVATEHGWVRTDVEVMDVRAPRGRGSTWTPLVVGQDARYDVDVDGDRFFVRTNEGAPNYRLFRVEAAHLERSAWTEIVPERPDATLQGVSVVGHRIALAYVKDVASEIELRDENGKLVRNVDLPAVGSSSGLVGDVDDDLAYYAFQSFTFPSEIFQTNVLSGATRSYYSLRVPVDASKYVAEQFFAKSADGTRIPFFVVRDARLAANGHSPTILSGYGGFSIPLTPVFSPSVFPWLERGGIWVVANLRGGSEYGELWHKHGMRHEKQHVFDDYIAVAEEMVHRGFTRPQDLVAMGSSNGGLLVGAAITQRPDLFGVALCGVPLLDMVRYPQFGSGKTWIEEYGDPSDPADFASLYAYSPIHHVTFGRRYPATLLLSADKDDRVDPVHARKFAAALQFASSGGPVLLRIEKHSGHGGADMVKASVDRIADEYAFALSQVEPPSGAAPLLE
jgi:prolyl oligopeptidase